MTIYTDAKMDRPTDNVVFSNPFTSKQVPRREKVAENADAIEPQRYAALFGPGTVAASFFESNGLATFVAKNTEYVSRQASQGGQLLLGSINAHVDDSATTWFTGVWNTGAGLSTVRRQGD